MIGAPYDDTSGPEAGSAYVYDLASATPETPVLTLNNPGPEVIPFTAKRSEFPSRSTARASRSARASTIIRE